MNKFLPRPVTCLLVASLTLLCCRAALAMEKLICCGAKEVFILQIYEDTTVSPKLAWSWKAEDSAEIPAASRGTFASTDECKAVGEFILITSSSGGVALIRRRDKSCQFLTYAKNAHSACLLPDYRVAVASSFGGDELLVYKLAKPNGSPAKPMAAIPLRGAHGTVWDKELNRLWALGSDELLLVDIGDEQEPKLRVDRRFDLPTPGGHDLAQTRDKSVLWVTTNKHVYRFSKKNGRFAADPTLADQPKVKSVCEHPRTGEIVYHQATPKHWWSDTIRFVGDRKAIQLPGRRLYKIRWDHSK